MQHSLCLISEPCKPRIPPGEQHKTTCLSIKGYVPWCRIMFPILQPNELASHRVQINPPETVAPTLRQILPEASCGTQRLLPSCALCRTVQVGRSIGICM